MSNLVALLRQYEILKQMANFLSTIDLFHLALTDSELYTLILQSQGIFNRLKSVALCDGHGLKARQEFNGNYEVDADHCIWGRGRKSHFDEEIKVRVWNLRCDPTNGLPCIKCNVNVCEVRYSNNRFRGTLLMIKILGMPIRPARPRYGQNAFLSKAT
jgi:hypothetical protein